MITPQHLERIRTRVCDQEDGYWCPHVINEELFKRVLIRERKRADRSNQQFILLLVDMNDGLGAGSSSIWEEAIEALTAAKREMDVLGWFERRAVIGLILPEIRVSDLANTREDSTLESVASSPTGWARKRSAGFRFDSMSIPSQNLRERRDFGA